MRLPKQSTMDIFLKESHFFKKNLRQGLQEMFQKKALLLQEKRCGGGDSDINDPDPG